MSTGHANSCGDLEQLQTARIDTHPSIRFTGDPTTAVPCFLSAITEPFENRLRVVSVRLQNSSAGHFTGNAADQNVTLGQVKDMVDVVFVAPTHQSLIAVSPVSTKNDLRLRPSRTKLLNQSLCHRAGVMGCANTAGTQIGDEHLVATEDIQRQKAMAITASIEVVFVLIAMRRIYEMPARKNLARELRTRFHGSVIDSRLTA